MKTLLLGEVDLGTVATIVISLIALLVPIGMSILWFVFQGVREIGQIKTAVALNTLEQHETASKIDSWKQASTEHQKDAAAHFLECEVDRATLTTRTDEHQRRIQTLET